MVLNFYTSVEKGLKLNVRKFLGLMLTAVEVTGQKLVGETFCLLILDRVKIIIWKKWSPKEVKV